MITQRIVEGLQQQRWTAVVIELLIVVLGVFIGIQVSNWNEERVARTHERAYLLQLRDEIVENRSILEYQVSYVDRVVASGQSALHFLAENTECVQECEALLVDFFHSSQVWGTTYSLEIYQESKSLGFPSNASTAQAVTYFYRLIKDWDLVNTSPPAYREHIRGHFPPDVSEVLWSSCHEMEKDYLEVLQFNCMAALLELDVRPTLASIRADAILKNQLQFWIGQNLFALQAYRGLTEAAHAAIAAIDRNLALAG